MNEIWRLPIMVLLWTAASVLSAQTARPSLTFLTVRSHDFGIYHERVSKAVVFIVKNTGKAPLVFHKAETSCGCTGVFFTRGVVAPGQRAYIKVVYDGNGFTQGLFRKSCRIFTNASKEPVELEIRGGYFLSDE